MRNRESETGGFTLVELIVASTLMVLVLSVVYLTFSTAVRAWRSGESNYGPYEDARRAFNLLDRELNCIPMEALHLVIGRADGIEFVTLAPSLDVAKSTGVHLLHLRYRIAEVDDAQCLVREESPVTPPLPLPPGPNDRGLPAQLNLGRRQQFVVARDVVSFSLGYRWPAPPPAIVQAGPPKPVKIMTDTRTDLALPQGITVELTVRDPGNQSAGGVSSFRESVSFRFPASPAPESVLRREGFRQ